MCTWVVAKKLAVWSRDPWPFRPYEGLKSTLNFKFELFRIFCFEKKKNWGLRKITQNMVTWPMWYMALRVMKFLNPSLILNLNYLVFFVLKKKWGLRKITKNMVTWLMRYMALRPMKFLNPTLILNLNDFIRIFCF